MELFQLSFNITYAISLPVNCAGRNFRFDFFMLPAIVFHGVASTNELKPLALYRGQQEQDCILLPAFLAI
jgi:hypothetical protein